MLNTKLLFHLIKNLSPSEKRRFKLDASLYDGQKNYMELFHVMEEMEEHNEYAIFQHEKVQSFAKDFHVIQNYLYKKLMQSLRHQHEEKMLVAKVDNLIQEANILEKKGCHDLSEKSLDKALKIASKHHQYLKQLDILSQKTLKTLLHSTKQLVPTIHELKSEAQKTIQHIEKETQLRYTHHLLIAKQSTKRVVNDTSRSRKLFDEINELHLKKSPNIVSPYILYYFHASRGSYFFLIQQLEKAKEEFKHALAIWEKYDYLQIEDTRRYMTILTNLITICIVDHSYDEVVPLIDQLKAVKVDSIHEESFKFQEYYHNKLTFLLQVKNYEEALLLIPAIEEELPKVIQSIQPSRLLCLYYNIGIAHFLTGHYEKADVWINKILSLPRTDESRKDIQRFARILQLAIYYQLGNHEMLEYMIRSVYRNKLVKEDMQLFDKLILQYYKKLQRVIPDSEEAIFLFKELQEKLTKLKEEQRFVTGYEDFNTWLDMMLENQKK